MNHKKEPAVGGRRRQASPKRGKKLALGLFALAVVGGGGIVAKSTLLNGHEAPAAISPLVVKEIPKTVSGLSIKIPDAQRSTGSLCVTPYNEDQSKAEKEQCAVKPVLTITIDGSCPIEKDGSIGAPSDWTLGCEYRDKRGGVAYLGHSVHGPIVGAFEKIGLLEKGDLVEVGGLKYQVALVSKFPASALPNRLWEKNHISLITCFEGAAQDAGAEVTQDVVVELTDVPAQAAA